MDTSKIKKFAPKCRIQLIEQISVKVDYVLSAETPDLLAQKGLVKALANAVKRDGKEAVVDQVAYTWFNRFAAIRYLDAKGWHPFRLRVISPSDEADTQPDLLRDVRKGVLPEELSGFVSAQRVNELLDGKLPSPNPQAEVQCLLIIGVCQFYASLLPWLFEKVDDFAQLLLPDDLLTEQSVVHGFRNEISDADCEDVEVIGWLYQFYISERKDDVFAALKKGKKITPENIPAATQLFTPHWIVRYLVENSLGRLWMLNHPESRLIEQMDYYIRPEEPETDFLRINSPEEIKICDPACGSGHMLTYAFDLLYAIYEEQGYQATDIPRLILTHNLYGIEIDQRAGALAAFALTMKAREKYRRFLTGGKVVQPNICVLENISIDPEDLSAYMDKVGRDLFSGGLQGVVNQWEEADNFGSLIRPLVTDVSEVLEHLRERQLGEDLFLAGVHQKVLTALRQADYLSPKYHVVVANPPYMGTSGLNDSMREFSASFFEHSKEDLYCMFIERFAELSGNNGLAAFITMHSWMFGERYRRFRPRFLGENSILCLAHFGAHAFDSIGGEVVQTAAAVSQAKQENASTVFHRLVDGEDEAAKRGMLLEDANRYVLECSRFAAIDGWPIVYWLPKEMLELFNTLPSFDDVATTRKGIVTGDNDRFIRYWFEVSSANTSLTSMSRDESVASQARWFPYTKGGTFRKWYGNQEFVVNWQNDGEEMRNNPHSSGTRNAGSNFNLDFIFREGITWNNISSSSFGFRLQPAGSLFDQKGSMLFSKGISHLSLLAYLNCSVASLALSGLCPTLDINSGSISKLPYDEGVVADTETIQRAVEIAESDWNASEMSPDFSTLPLIPTSDKCEELRDLWTLLRSLWLQQVNELMEIETANNRQFANGYGLAESVLRCIRDDEIGLNVNPVYRYDDDKSESELEALLLADTMREFISYAVGCMLGRYSLDKPGLILANQGETFADYVRIVGEYLVASSEKGEADGSEELSRTDSLAEGDGLGGNDLSVDEAVSEGGDLRSDGSDSTSSSVHSLKHSGRSGEEIVGGLPKVSSDRSGVESGSGNTTTDSSSSQLPNSGTTNSSHESAGRNQQNEQLAAKQAEVTHNSLLDAQYSFLPDEDNVIPLLDGDWFEDDITERFKAFLKVTFGTEHYEENLTFLENGLYPDNLTGKKRKTIRDYFLKEFYNHHVQLYKKRPIYWLFQSPKKSFSALIYMHRYTKDTVNTLLNGYVREYLHKLSGRIEHLEDHSARGDLNPKEKRDALKELDKLRKALKDVEDYERNILLPLAQQRIEIDLDDGVKANYPKFGSALAKVSGL